MIVTTKNRKKVYDTLYREGVLYAPKNHFLPSHPLCEGVRNIEVCKLMTSLKSRGFVEEHFCWQHLYWTLTDQGIEHLREYLNLPQGVLPTTKQSQNNDIPAPVAPAGGRGQGRGRSMGGRGGGFGRGGRMGGRGGFGRGGFGGQQRTPEE